MAARNVPSPLLALPRETRDQIYRELLTPTIGNQKRDSYGLEPALLRVNRQMHKEASEVLYNESCWVLFTTNGPLFVERDGYASYTNTPVIVLLRGESAFGGQFAMRIDVTTLSEYHDNHSTSLSWIVASVFDLQRTLNGLMWHLPPSRFQLVVGTHDPFQKHRQHHERILECLYGVRGVASASVQGKQLQYLDKEIECRMMTQYEHCDERTEQLHSLFDAWYFLFGYPGNEAEYSSRYTQVLVLRTAAAFCSFKVGHIAEARSEISLVLREREPNIQDTQRATALYVRGLIILAEDLYTDASIVFHKALTLRPEYEAVVQELGRTEAKTQMLKDTDNES